MGPTSNLLQWLETSRVIQKPSQWTRNNSSSWHRTSLIPKGSFVEDKHKGNSGTHRCFQTVTCNVPVYSFRKAMVLGSEWMLRKTWQTLFQIYRDLFRKRNTTFGRAKLSLNFVWNINLVVWKRGLMSKFTGADNN